MYYIINPRGELCEVRTPDQDFGQNDRAKMVEMGYEVLCDWDVKSFNHAKTLAAQASLNVGRKFLPVDRGTHHSPQFGITEMPVVGLEVSRAVNGDYYPEGKVVKVSDSGRRVETDTGVVFWRRNQTGVWVHHGVWSMVRGHVSRLSPEF
jgi:hypothetical protein